MRRSLLKTNTAHKSHQESAWRTLRSADRTGLWAAEGQSDARPSCMASGNGGRTRWSCSLKAPGSSQGPGAAGGAHRREDQRDGGRLTAQAEDTQHTPNTRERNKLSEGSPHAPLVSTGEQVQPRAGPRAGTVRPECRGTPGRQQAGGPEGRTGPWTRTRRLCRGGHTTPSGTHKKGSGREGATATPRPRPQKSTQAERQF